MTKSADAENHESPRAPSLAEIVAQRYGWTEPIALPQLWEPLCWPGGRVTFGMLVAARGKVWEPSVQAEALAVGRLLRAKFERRQGTIQNSYFCHHTRGGCALTERIEGSGRRERVIRILHTVLNSGVGQLVTIETECGVLADDVAAAFGQRRSAAPYLRMATDRLYSVMTRVMVAADACGQDGAAEEERQAAVEMARAEYALVSRKIQASIQRYARFVYFQGVMIGTALAIGASAGVGAAIAHNWARVVSPPALLAASVFGALGALASVFQRMSTGRLVLDFTAPRAQLVTLGGIRPAIGALFGAVTQFVLVAGVLGAAPGGRLAATSFATFAITGFAAGFSERFATDMLERAGVTIAGVSIDEASAASATRSRNRRSGATVGSQPPVGVRPEPDPHTAAASGR